MSECPRCGKAADESDFFLKTLGEVPAQTSLLAYVKPERKILFTQELLLEWSDISIAAGQNVQINRNIQVLNHCQGVAEGFQQAGAVVFLSSSLAEWQDDVQSAGIIDSKEENMKQTFKIQVCN